MEVRHIPTREPPRPLSLAPGPRSEFLIYYNQLMLLTFLRITLVKVEESLVGKFIITLNEELSSFESI